MLVNFNLKINLTKIVSKDSFQLFKDGALDEYEIAKLHSISPGPRKKSIFQI